MDKYNSSAGMNYFNKQPEQSLLQHNQADTLATSSDQFQPPPSKVQNPGNGNYVGGNNLAIQQTYQMTKNHSNYLRNDAGVKFATVDASFVLLKKKLKESQNSIDRHYYTKQMLHFFS